MDVTALQHYNLNEFFSHASGVALEAMFVDWSVEHFELDLNIHGMNFDEPWWSLWL